MKGINKPYTALTFLKMNLWKPVLPQHPLKIKGKLVLLGAGIYRALLLCLDSIRGQYHAGQWVYKGPQVKHLSV